MNAQAEAVLSIEDGEFEIAATGANIVVVPRYEQQQQPRHPQQDLKDMQARMMASDL